MTARAFALTAALLCVLAFPLVHTFQTPIHTQMPTRVLRPSFSRPLGASVVDCPKGAFDAEVLQCEIPVVVDFHADWCGPCKLMGPIFKAVAGAYSDNVKFVKVDVDIMPEYIEKYNIHGLPLLAVFSKGEIIGKHEGALPNKDLQRVIDVAITAA